MQNAASQPIALPRNARAPMWAKYGTWTVLALVGIALTDGALFLVHQRAAAWVDHSRIVRGVARDARLAVSDRRAAIDAFIITRDSSLLISDRPAQHALAAGLDSLVSLTADNADQQRRATAIKQAYAVWDATFATPALSLHGSGDALKRSGVALFAPLSERFAEFVAAEDELYRDRRDRDKLLALATLLLTVVPIGVLVTIAFAMRRRLQTQMDAILYQQTLLEEQAIEL